MPIVYSQISENFCRIHVSIINQKWKTQRNTEMHASKEKIHPLPIKVTKKKIIEFL